MNRPGNIEAEHIVLGCALYDNKAVDLAEGLRPEHFSEPTHGRLWGSLLAHRNAGSLAEPIILRGEFEHDPGFQSLGGVVFLADLVDASPPVHNVPDYAQLIIDASIRRSIHDLTDHAKSAALQAGSGEAILGLLERGCADIAREDGTGPSAKPLGLRAVENLDAAQAGDFQGVQVGIKAIDRVTGGIKQDDVWVIGGRSSMGKSIMGLALARGIAEQGLGVLMFSLEMPTREVEARVIADLSHRDYAGVKNVRYSDALRGRLDVEQFERARDSARKIASLPFNVTDRGGLTIDDIRSQALRQVRAWERSRVKAGVILIDHLGLVMPVRKTDNKAADTSDTVNELKSIAKQLRCPIIALAQVNRGPENRSDKRPTMGDLNWSGSIEQIADFVCLLYRQSYYDSRSPDHDQRVMADANEHDLELLIQKNRSGPVCTVKAWIDIASNAVRDLPEYAGRAA